MTILNDNSRMTYIGNGAVNTYSFTYKIFNQDDLLVTVKHPTTGVETTLTITTDYTVSISANGTGSITLVNASQVWLTSGSLTSAWTLVIRRVVDIVQETDIRNQGTFFPENHEDVFDYLTMISQQLSDDVTRSIKTPETESSSLTLPSVAARSGNLLGFDSNGFPIATEAASGAAIVSGAGQVVVSENTLNINNKTYVMTGTVDPKVVAVDAPKASLYLNYSTNKVYKKLDNGSSTNWTELVTTLDSQTLTNKTLTSPTINTPTVDVPVFSHQTTPSNPASGYVKLFAKNDNKFYRLTSAGIERGVGGGPSLGTDSIIRTNAKTIDENIVFAGTENGSTVGPVTISAGYTVTVTTGSTWVIV